MYIYVMHRFHSQLGLKLRFSHPPTLRSYKSVSPHSKFARLKRQARLRCASLFVPERVLYISLEMKPRLAVVRTNVWQGCSLPSQRGTVSIPGLEPRGGEERELGPGPLVLAKHSFQLRSTSSTRFTRGICSRMRGCRPRATESCPIHSKETKETVARESGLAARDGLRHWIGLTWYL